MNALPVFERALQKAHGWLDAVNEELGWVDRGHAYGALRATLHALRDRLTVDEAADLAAQLPMLVRGVFYEGWDPSSTPARIRHRDEFLEPITRAILWEPSPDAERVARAVFAVLCREVSRGEIDDVIASLPEEIRQLFPSGAVADWRRRQVGELVTAGAP
jgi:uncharacterized protein (DUF2267 family)